MKEARLMQQIVSSKKYPNGIQVFRADAGKDGADFFRYEELIDMKINVFDVLNNPKIYQIDAGEHRIESSV
jgi:hypothetical protein